ncbi:MAG TPA: carboxypeptidase-like regulatory domain-containing protein [Candidatus Methanomethylophilaceae archaeon]|nr:carboxypeptidase-like regulatory domain-containing protein [Candidatus Methanomethylophilaceae archaeon]
MRKLKRLIGRNRISNNRRGGIEGLPLQLIIVMLIATMGTAIILGWMGNIEGPKVIGDVDVTSDEIVLVNGSTLNGRISIVVTDQDGNPIEGATVVLTGLGITDRNGKTPHGTTDSKGYANIMGLNITMKNSAIGFITVNVSASGYGENNTARVTVIG